MRWVAVGRSERCSTHAVATVQAVVEGCSVAAADSAGEGGGQMGGLRRGQRQKSGRGWAEKGTGERGSGRDRGSPAWPIRWPLPCAWTSAGRICPQPRTTSSRRCSGSAHASPLHPPVPCPLSTLHSAASTDSTRPTAIHRPCSSDHRPPSARGPPPPISTRRQMHCTALISAAPLAHLCVSSLAHSALPLPWHSPDLSP